MQIVDLVELHTNIVRAQFTDDAFMFTPNRQDDNIVSIAIALIDVQIMLTYFIICRRSIRDVTDYQKILDREEVTATTSLEIHPLSMARRATTQLEEVIPETSSLKMSVRTTDSRRITTCMVCHAATPSTTAALYTTTLHDTDMPTTVSIGDITRRTVAVLLNVVQSETRITVSIAITIFRL